MKGCRSRENVSRLSRRPRRGIVHGEVRQLQDRIKRNDRGMGKASVKRKCEVRKTCKYIQRGEVIYCTQTVHGLMAKSKS